MKTYRMTKGELARTAAISVMVYAAAVLFVAEASGLIMLCLIKAAAIGLGATALKIEKRWAKAGKLNYMKQLSMEE